MDSSVSLLCVVCNVMRPPRALYTSLPTAPPSLARLLRLPKILTPYQAFVEFRFAVYALHKEGMVAKAGGPDLHLAVSMSLSADKTFGKARMSILLSSHSLLPFFWLAASLSVKAASPIAASRRSDLHFPCCLGDRPRQLLLASRHSLPG